MYSNTLRMLLEETLDAIKVKDMGNISYKSGKMDESVAYYTMCIFGDPENPVFYTNRALAYIATKRYLEAMVDCQRCLSIDKDNVKAYSLMGKCLYELGLYKHSISMGYQKAYEISGNERYVRLIEKCSSAIEKQIQEEEAELGGGGGGVRDENEVKEAKDEKEAKEAKDEKEAKEAKDEKEAKETKETRREKGTEKDANRENKGFLSSVDYKEVLKDPQSLSVMEQFMEQQELLKQRGESPKPPKPRKSNEIPPNLASRLSDPEFIARFRESPKFKELAKSPLFRPLVERFLEDPIKAFSSLDEESIEFLEKFQEGLLKTRPTKKD